MEKLDQLMGISPTLVPGINDTVGLLSKTDRQRLRSALDRFQRRFPQVAFHVWLGRTAPQVPLHLYLFWLFNRGTLFATVTRGAVNRDVLLGIDVTQQRASIIIGYGLEPFLGGRHLNAMLDAAGTDLAAQDWRRGIQSVLERLSDALTEIHLSLHQTYGAEPIALGIAAPETPEEWNTPP
jgi:uncharacterized membrane protein YgcG